MRFVGIRVFKHSGLGYTKLCMPASSKHHHEMHRRSLAKTVTYRIITIIVDIIIIYPLTKRADVTISVVILTNVASSLLYFIHERAWNFVGWGKHAK